MKKYISFIFLFIFGIFLASCNESDSYKLSVSGPSGAPSVCVVDMLNKYSDEYDFNLSLDASTGLPSAFSEKESDVIIAPINLGAKQYANNKTYKLSAVLTWGNLYLASRKENFKLEDLNNHEVYFFGEATINAVIVNYILEKKNITPSNIEYLESTVLTQAKLVSDENAIVLIAEPILSQTISKKEGISYISVQKLYQEVSNKNSYPQAGCFIKASTIDNHKKVIDLFLSRLEASASKVTSNPEEIAQTVIDLKILSTPFNVTLNALPNCNIRYVKALDAKDDIESLVALKKELFGKEMPIDEFYYE